MRGIVKTAGRLWRWVLGVFGKEEPVMSLADEWLALGHRLYEKAKAIFDHSNVPESEAGIKDPKVVALTLLARTMGNFQAACCCWTTAMSCFDSSGNFRSAEPAASVDLSASRSA
jgi:hypothetical protein